MDEQQMPMPMGSPYMAPMERYGNNIAQLTNPENEIVKMELSLKSMRINSEGKIEQIGEPLMNDLGISSITGTVQSVVNQVTILSNLSKQNIQTILMFMADTIAKDLMLNRVKYDIKSVAVREKIFFMAISTAFITMCRADEEGLSDKKFWGRTYQEIQSKFETGQRRDGLLSRLNTWRK